MRKSRIGVDVDGVLAIHFDRTIDLLNERYNVYLSPADITDYRYEESYLSRFSDIDRDDIKQFVKGLWTNPEYFAESAPSLPMLKACRELSGMSLDPQGITVITARQDSLQESTKLWLDRYGIAYKQIVHTNNKAEYCRDNKFNYMVEDAPHQAEQIAAKGIGVFLIDYPYNQNVEATGLNGIWRIHNPVEIPPLIRIDRQ